MTLVNLGRALLLAAFAAVVAANAEQLWTLYLVAFVLGVGETLFDTAAQSILPAIVADKAQLSKANGQLTAVERITNQFIGPTLGALVAAAALAGSLSASSAAYGLASVALLTLGRPVPRHTQRARHRDSRPTSPTACATSPAIRCCARSRCASACRTWRRR